MRTADELSGKKLIALTFDDGPDIEITPPILDLIEQYRITASFFVVGENITDETAGIVRREHALGCEINNHSFTHSSMDKMTPDEIKSEIKRTSDLVYEHTGMVPKFFRPPYIAVSSVMYESIDLPFIGGIGCNDWDSAVSVEERVTFLTEQCPEKSIILLHDQENNTKTVEALTRAIPKMISSGFVFVTVSELFASQHITPVPHQQVIYNRL